MEGASGALAIDGVEETVESDEVLVLVSIEELVLPLPLRECFL